MSEPKTHEVIKDNIDDYLSGDCTIMIVKSGIIEYLENGGQFSATNDRDEDARLYRKHSQQVGDTVIVRESYPAIDSFTEGFSGGGLTGRTCKLKITHIQKGISGLSENWWALSVRLIGEKEQE